MDLNLFALENIIRIQIAPQIPEPVVPAISHMKFGVNTRIASVEVPAAIAALISTLANATAIQIGAITA